MTDENYEARAQAHLASLKRDMKASMEDAVVRAMHKVMAEFEAKSDQRLMEMPEKFAGFDVVVDASLPPGTMKFEQPAQRCPLCNYQHGHAIGCKNNPVDIALNKMAKNARELGLDYEQPAQQEPGRNHWEDGDVFERIAASKKQPAQQEPVAWINWCAATGKRSVSFECESELASQPLYEGITQNTQYHYSKFHSWFDSELHRQKYTKDHPAYLAAQEAWNAANDAAQHRFNRLNAEIEAWKVRFKIAEDALAKLNGPEQKPVATMWQHGETGRTRITMPGDITDCDARWFKVSDLYTSPPASKPWVGLTDVEWQEIDASLNGKRDLARIFVRAIEAKLKEKNA